MNMILAFSLVSGFSAHACLGEAQVIAKVASVQTFEDYGTCFVALKEARHFAENGTCPLYLEEINASGIQFQMVNEQCPLKAGDELSGVVVRTQDGTLILE
jgi:hypothetical protein